MGVLISTMAGVIGLILGMLIEMMLYSDRIKELEAENSRLRNRKPRQMETIEVIEIKDERSPKEDYFKPF